VPEDVAAKHRGVAFETHQTPATRAGSARQRKRYAETGGALQRATAIKRDPGKALGRREGRLRERTLHTQTNTTQPKKHGCTIRPPWSSKKRHIAGGIGFDPGRREKREVRETKLGK